MFSVGERSEECAGHNNNRTFFISSKVWIIPITCQRALSYWKVTFCRILVKSKATGLTQHKFKRLLFKVTLIQTRNNRDEYPMAFHTNSSNSRPVWRCQMKVRNVPSLLQHWKRMWPSWYWKKNPDFSENTTSWHSCVRLRLWRRHCMHSCLYCNVKGNWSQAHSPYC